MYIIAQEKVNAFNDTIDRAADDFVTAYLVVSAPADVLYSVLGHACIRLTCPTYNLDYCFSYESESIPDKVFTFLAGKLKMGMFNIPTETFLEGMREEGREVKQYKLNLTPHEKQELWRVLDDKVAEGTNLPYDYIRRGCAVSCVHSVKKALGATRIEYAPWDDYFNNTIKEICYNNAVNSYPWNMFITETISAGIAERDCTKEEKLVIPVDLVRVWQTAKVNGKALLSSEAEVLVDGNVDTEQIFFTPLLASLLLLLITTANLFWKKTYIDYCILVLQTTLGCIITYLVCFSNLPATEWNWLIIPFNPLPAICWYWRKYWVLPWIVIMLIWIIVMLCLPHKVVAPAHVVLVLSWTLILLHQSNIWQKVRKKCFV